LTVDTPPKVPDARIGRALAAVLEASADAKDPLIPFLVWMAAEPKVAADPQNAFQWLRDRGMAAMPLSGQLLAKTMRRLCDTRRQEFLDQAVAWLASLPGDAAPLALAGVNGLIEGQKGNPFLPGKPARDLLAKWFASPNRELAVRAQELGALWGDAAAVQAALRLAADSRAGVDERVEAIQVIRQLKNDDARHAMLELVSQENRERILIEALEALSQIGGDIGVAEAMVKRWPNFSPATRSAAAEVLASRNHWSEVLLSAIESKTVAASEIPATVIRTLFRSKDSSVRERAAKAIGRFREPDADKLKLIAAKRQVVLNGPIDWRAGRELAKKTCLVCHKFYDEGAEVGPDLTGVGRSTLDALLHNVIAPNEIVGKGYENVEVETKDGRSVSGRLVEDTETRVRLLSAGPKEEVVARSDIATMRVSELSVMPEGLEQMPDDDFRNLINYILKPPQDNLPVTPQRSKELPGQGKH